MTFLSAFMASLTVIWGIFSLVWLIITLLGLYKLRRLRNLIDDARSDLDIMTSTLDKFRRAEMPLDKAIIEAHMRYFKHAELSFKSKMELYEKFK